MKNSEQNKLTTLFRLWEMNMDTENNALEKCAYFPCTGCYFGVSMLIFAVVLLRKVFQRPLHKGSM